MSIMRRIKVLNSVTKEQLSLWCHHRKHQLLSRICESNKKYIQWDPANPDTYGTHSNCPD